MFAKIAVLCLCVAVAYAGVVGVASPPASTTLLANPQVVQLVHQPAIHQVAAVRSVVAAPAATVLAAPHLTQVVAAPQVIQTGTKIVQTVEPVEQHGYRIAY